MNIVRSLAWLAVIICSFIHLYPYFSLIVCCGLWIFTNRISFCLLGGGSVIAKVLGSLARFLPVVCFFV